MTDEDHRRLIATCAGWEALYVQALERNISLRDEIEELRAELRGAKE